jgi:hypothetical protein
MATYDLYHTETGALIRSQDFAEPPVNPAGKPWAWQLQNTPAPVGGIPAQWHNGAWRSAPVYSDATHHAPVWSGAAWAEPVAKSLALLKAEKTAAITERRWEVETGGITLNGAAIATDPTSQAKLSGALQLVQSDDTRILDWKGVNGWISLNAADVTAIAVSVGGHVQACFTREKEMLAAVTAAETTAALALVDPQAGTIDGAGGWPT